MLGKKENQKLMAIAWQKAFTRNPERFVFKYVYPLLPQTAKLEVAVEGVRRWTDLCDTYHIEPNEPYMEVQPDSESSAVAADGAKPCALLPTSSIGRQIERPATTDGSPPPTSSQTEPSKPLKK